MEHIEGENLEQIAWDKDRMLPRVAAAVREIHSISNRIPGPVSGAKRMASYGQNMGRESVSATSKIFKRG
jgi:hypothetical protein